MTNATERKLSTVEDVGPSFENFPPKVEAIMRGILDRLPLPLGRITAFKYVEDPDLANVGAALYDPITREIHIQGPFTLDRPEDVYAFGFRFVRTLFHELAHATIDLSAYVVRDSQRKLVLDASGNETFDESLLELYGTLDEAKRLVVQLMYGAGQQAHDTGKYVDGYQKKMSVAFWAIDGEIRFLAGLQYELKHNEPILDTDSEEIKKFKEDRIRLKEFVDLMLVMKIEEQKTFIDAYYAESFAIILENALLNPKNLHDKTESQRTVWKSEGLATEHQTLGEGPVREFIEVEALAQELLQRVFGTNAEGVEMIRQNLLAYIHSLANSQK